MQLSTLWVILLVIGALIGVRLALLQLCKPNTELPVETTTPQASTAETFSQTSAWPVVVLLCVVVTLIVSLMLFGKVLAGG